MVQELLAEGSKQSVGDMQGADVVFGLFSCDTWDSVHAATAAIGEVFQVSAPSMRVTAVHSDQVSDGVNAPTADSLPSQVRLLPSPGVAVDRLRNPLQVLNESQRSLFAISHDLRARACIVFGSEPANITAELIHRLLEPLVTADFDLVMPCYARRRFEGLLNNSLVYPLTRAIYGKSVRSPLGLDFGVSARLVERYVSRATDGSRNGLPAWILSDAIRAGFQLCQTYVQSPLQSARDASDASTLLAQVLGTIFSDLEYHAAFWQKVRGSKPLTTFGKPAMTGEDSAAVDAMPLIESFRLGFNNLAEVWRIALPPGTLLELKRLSLMPPDRFGVPDELWVRIVYDFALAHHGRTMSRDHLLRAMTPVYLAWVASYALEAQRVRIFNVEQRIEQLCSAFEAQKPYLQSRWRWPDRFNP